MNNLHPLRPSFVLASLLWLSFALTAAAAWSSVMTMSSSSSIKTVTVLGGTGFVGSRVCKLLVEQTGGDVQVTSISKSGSIPKWCKDADWTQSVVWKSIDLLAPSSDGGDNDSALDAAIGSPNAMISCVGVVGTDPDVLLQGNGETNVRAFASAQRGTKLSRAVLVSVSSEVAACQENWLPEFFQGYFEGKKQAEEAALQSVGNDPSKLCVIKPTFIYGGDGFGLFPPRVNDAYGSAVEELLSLGLISSLADITPGLIKVALRPPSSVDAVASACVAGVLGELSGDLDGGSAINAATNQPDATGLTEAIDWAKENAIKAYDWAKVEVPKAIDVVKSKIDESSKK